MPIICYCPDPGNAARVASALGERIKVHGVLGPFAEALLETSAAVVWSDDLRHPKLQNVLRTARIERPVRPIILVTSGDRKRDDSLLGYPADAVVWSDELHRVARSTHPVVEILDDHGTRTIPLTKFPTRQWTDNDPRGVAESLRRSGDSAQARAASRLDRLSNHKLRAGPSYFRSVTLDAEWSVLWLLTHAAGNGTRLVHAIDLEGEPAGHRWAISAGGEVIAMAAGSGWLHVVEEAGRDSVRLAAYDFSHELDPPTIRR